MSKTIQSLLLLSLLGCSTEFPTRSNPRYIARDVEGDVGVPVPQGGEEGDSGTGGNQNILDSSLEVEDGFVQDARLLDSDVDQAQDDSTVSRDSVPVQDRQTPADSGIADASPPPNPFYVDDDEDGFTEAEGDCDDQHADRHPGVMERCDDGADNDCNQLFDFEDPVCAALTDTIITVWARDPIPAMILSAESYNRAQDIDGWQVFSTSFHQRNVEVVLPAITFPANTFCGIRFNVSYYRDRNDVLGENNLVGEPDNWLCEIDENGQLFNDPLLSTVRVQVNGEEYDIGFFTLSRVPGESGCSMFLVLNQEGDCAL